MVQYFTSDSIIITVFALKKGRTEPIKFGRKEKNDHEYRWDSSIFNQMGKVGAPEQK